MNNKKIILSFLILFIVLINFIFCKSPLDDKNTDINHRLTKISFYSSSNDYLWEYFTYEYDGNKIKKTKYIHPNYTMEFCELYEYNDEDNLIKLSSCNSDYDSSDGIHYEYDVERKLIKKFYEGGYWIYEYDENGNLKKEFKYRGKSDGRNRLVDYKIYEYDNNRNKIRDNFYDKKGNLKDYYTIYEYDNNNNLIKRSIFKSDGKLRKYFVYEYDKNNNKVKEYFYSNGALVDYYIYEYDENNNLIKRTIYNDDGSPHRYMIFEYEPVPLFEKAYNVLKQRF